MFCASHNKIFQSMQTFSWAWWHRPVVPAPQEAETTRSQVQDLPRLHTQSKASKPNLVEPCLKMKSPKRN